MTDEEEKIELLKASFILKPLSPRAKMAFICIFVKEVYNDMQLTGNPKSIEQILVDINQVVHNETLKI